jgi:hypothetical protein
MRDNGWDRYKDDLEYLRNKITEQCDGVWIPQPRKPFTGPVVEEILEEIEKEKSNADTIQSS